MVTSSGARGSRKESQFAEILRRVGWRVEGPKPRARFMRTDYWNSLDLLALRRGAPSLLLAQLTDKTSAARKRAEIDREVPRSVVPNGGATAVIVGAWGHRAATGYAWKVEERASRGWVPIGHVALDGTVIQGSTRRLRLLLSRSTDNVDSGASEADGRSGRAIPAGETNADGSERRGVSGAANRQQ